MLFLMLRRPPVSTRTATLLPDTTLFLSPRQVDIPGGPMNSGLNDAVSRLEGIEGFGTIRFTAADVVRHPIVGRIVEAYEGEGRSEEHTSELQSLMRISSAVFCLKKKNTFITPSLHLNISTLIKHRI